MSYIENKTYKHDCILIQIFPLPHPNFSKVHIFVTYEHEFNFVNKCFNLDKTLRNGK